jgi:hypothetical protein
MRKVFSIAVLTFGTWLVCAPFSVASTQPTTVNVVAVSPDNWTSSYTRAAFTLPQPSSSRPAATRFNDEILADSASVADVTVAAGRLEMPNSKLISLTADEMPPTFQGSMMTMIMTPSRPMALGGPLAIPEPGSLVLFASGMLSLPFLLRRKRPA